MRKKSIQLSTGEKALLLILALAIVGCVYYFFVHQPVTTSLDRCNREIDSLNTDISILSAKAVRLGEMRKELEEIKENGELTTIPEYDNLDKEMAFLYSVLNKTYDYSLSVQSVQKSLESTEVVRRSMSLRFTCPNYNAAKRAIARLQDSPYRSLVGAISIVKTEKNPSETIMEGAVVVNVNITFFERKI